MVVATPARRKARRAEQRVSLERELAWWEMQARMHETGAQDCREKIRQAEAKRRGLEGERGSD